MKLFLIIFFLVFPLARVSSAWEFKAQGHDFYLVGDLEAPAQIFVNAGEPVFIEEKPLDENHLLVVYNSGEVGTSQLVSVYRAVVINRKKKKVLGDYPYQYHGGQEYPQPKWTIEQQKLIIIDKVSDEQFELSLSEAP
jgi:hypothetical protein